MLLSLFLTPKLSTRSELYRELKIYMFSQLGTLESQISTPHPSITIPFIATWGRGGELEFFFLNWITALILCWRQKATSIMFLISKLERKHRHRHGILRMPPPLYPSIRSHGDRVWRGTVEAAHPVHWWRTNASGWCPFDNHRMPTRQTLGDAPIIPLMCS